ncbi:hypothetical protein KY289_007304 [Solanum tuberosum]|nr:hypothetical protein KY289_007304 [Solanum tuberosum]
MASSSSYVSDSQNCPRWKYNVFLSFRSADTQRTFTGHLYEGLKNRGIFTFQDDKRLENVDSIPEELLKAIEESQVAVIIFSKNYATSRWCLNELVKIMECKEEKGQIVIPVFYDVYPSEVRHQIESFAEAFSKHKSKYTNDIEGMKKVKQWRTARSKRFLCTFSPTNLASELAMASSNSALSVAQPLIPVFKGESYEFWSIRMKTILKSQDLWDLVECGFADHDEGNKLRSNKQKDAKALVFIQQVVHDSVFSRIATTTTSNQAWTILQKEFQGDSKVIVVRLQSLRRDFETLMMKSGECIAGFSSRATTIVSQIRPYGEKVTDQTIVEKVLRSLTPKFDHVVAAIEKSKDLSVFSFDELMGSLQTHEQAEVEEDEAFTVVEVVVMKGAEEEMIDTGSPMSKKINFAATKNEEKNHLFMACTDIDHKPSDLWFVDSDCSNHMTGVKSLFHELDEKQKKKVQPGNTKELLVEGKGMVSIDTNQDKVNMIDNVQFVPDLGYNLLSVGQLMTNGYSLLFDDDACVFTSKKSGKKTKSLGGSRYFLLFTDDYSRMSWVYFLENKSETFEKFQVFKALVENQSSYSITILRTDRRGEFVSNEFNFFCEKNGIHKELTAPYTPEQNGVAEWKNRTVVEMARNMLQVKELVNQFWAEAVAASVYLLNLSPTKAVMNKTPYELGIVGNQIYCTHSKAYRLYNPFNGKISVRRDVIFDENASWDWSEKLVRQETLMPLALTEDEGNESTPSSSLSGSSVVSQSSLIAATHEESSNEIIPLRRSTRLKNPNPKYANNLYTSCQFALIVSDPMNYEEAAGKEEWKKAMVEEMKSIEKNGTWEMIELPNGKNAIGLKWVFKTKVAADGSLQKHKAHLMAKGYAQQYGVDFEETFSLVARFETVRLVLALAAQLQWAVYQFDVKSASLNGDLQEEVYVTQLDGFIKEGDETKVYKLKKVLYGLKQAPRARYSKTDGYFHKNGYIRSENEPTLYVKKKGNVFIIVCLYVDDIIYTSSSRFLLEEFKSQMMNEFEMSDMGLLHYFLGLQVHQTEKRIFLSQRKYARDLLNKFGMLNCKPAATPMNISEKLQQVNEEELTDAKRFRSLVGGLIYLTHTRPDIAYHVGVISRLMQQPSKVHYGAAKRVLRYIAGTLDFGIWYSKTDNFRLCGYTDSDWTSSLDDRRSVSANVFTLGSGVVTWSSNSLSSRLAKESVS